METKSQKYPQQKISWKIIAPGNRISIIIQEQREKRMATEQELLITMNEESVQFSFHLNNSLIMRRRTFRVDLARVNRGESGVE